MVSDYIDEDLIDSQAVIFSPQVECWISLWLSLQIVQQECLERPECLYKDSICPQFDTILARAKIT